MLILCLIKDIVASCQPTSSEKAGAGAGLSLCCFLPGSQSGREEKFLAAFAVGAPEAAACRNSPGASSTCNSSFIAHRARCWPGRYQELTRKLKTSWGGGDQFNRFDHFFSKATYHCVSPKHLFEHPPFTNQIHISKSRHNCLSSVLQLASQ